MEPTELTPDEGDQVVDLSSLRSLGQDRHQALAARIDAAAMPALARRRRRGPPAVDVQSTLAGAAWPALIAAAAAVLLAVALGPGTAATTESQAALDLASVEGGLLPSTTDATWITEQRAPTNDDLAVAIGLGTAQ